MLYDFISNIWTIKNYGTHDFSKARSFTWIAHLQKKMLMSTLELVLMRFWYRNINCCHTLSATASIYYILYILVIEGLGKCSSVVAVVLQRPFSKGEVCTQRHIERNWEGRGVTQCHLKQMTHRKVSIYSRFIAIIFFCLCLKSDERKRTVNVKTAIP